MGVVVLLGLLCIPPFLLQSLLCPRIRLSHSSLSSLMVADRTANGFAARGLLLVIASNACYVIKFMLLNFFILA